MYYATTMLFKNIHKLNYLFDLCCWVYGLALARSSIVAIFITFCAPVTSPLPYKFVSIICMFIGLPSS